MHPDSTRAKAIAFVRRGMPIKVAADTTDVPVNTLRRWCQQEGIGSPKPTLTRRQAIDIKTDYALARAERGDVLTRHEIMTQLAERLNVDFSVIREALQR